MKVKMICFDMDGVLADLYNVNGWLEDLRQENPRPYQIAKPCVDMQELNMIITQLKECGYKITIISWLAKNASKEYDGIVRQAKKEWLNVHRFNYDEIHLIKYGTTKANAIRNKNIDEAILIDDNQKIREGWHLGEAINPTEIDIVEYLKGLLTE